jgi:hypothetical protein
MYCNFSKVRYKLPDDGPNGPKHVGAIQRDILNVNCSILYFNRECICWRQKFEWIENVSVYWSLLTYPLKHSRYYTPLKLIQIFFPQHIHVYYSYDFQKRTVIFSLWFPNRLVIVAETQNFLGSKK